MPEDYSIGYMWDPRNGVYVNIAQPYVGVPSEPVKGRKMTKGEKRTQKMLDEATEAFMRQADGSGVSGYPREAPLVEEHPLGALLVGRGFGKMLQGVAPRVAGYMRETAPLWKQAAKRMAIDLPAFEAIDRLPQAWGDERLTQQGTNLIKQTTPIGMYAPWAVDVAGPFIAGMVPGMLGDMAVRGTVAGVNGIMNGMARRAAANRMGYLGPVAEAMGESPVRTSAQLGGESQNHIQTLLENGEFNPMDLEVGPAGSGGSAPTNLVRNADGSVMRTPDGYVIRRGRDFTVDPNNPREFFYDNAGRRYESIAEATGSGRSIEAPEWTAEELTNFAVDAQNRLSSEEQQAFRDLIQQRVNETLDRMGASRRRVSSDPDYDELAAEASGLVRYEPIGNDSYILPDPPAEINIDLNSLTNSAPSGSQARRIVELYEPITGDAFNMDFPTLVREPRYLDEQPNYILREILDELRDPAIAPELGINSEEAGNLELAVSHRLVRNGEGAYEQLRHAIQNVDEVELRDFVNLLDNRNLSELESRYGWDLDALDSDGTSRLDNAIDELTRNARRRLRALSSNRITPPLSTGATTAPSETANTREAWDNFYRATEAGNVDDAIESYLRAEGITDRSEQSKRDAIKNILRRSDLPDAMRNSFVDWFEKEASGLSEKDVLSKYLEDVQNMMSIKVVDVHGDPAWSESSFLDDHRRGFSDEAYQRAKDKLENILDGVPVSERRAFRLSKEQFDDVYSEFEPLRFSQTENKVRSARAAGYARHLNKQSNNLGIDFSKFNTPEEFASEVQHGLRESGLVDARKHLPLDISGLSYRSMEDPRAEWLINKVYDSFRDPSKPYRGVMMDPYLSRSADSHRMAYMFSARNYGKHPGGVTWNLADWPAGSNQLERNSVYIDASGKPVFTNQRVARLARRAGLDKAFSPEEIQLLKNIADHSSAATDHPAYSRAKELAQFVQDYSTNSLRDPVEKIMSLDPSLNSTLMRVEPRTVESQASWLSTMLNPTHGQYISGLEGFKADFRHLPPAGILRHKHGGLLSRLQKHYGSGDKILEVLNKFEGGGPAMSFVPSENIRNTLKGLEGYSGSWYNDGNGIPTVGYGFTGRKVRELYPNGMTRAQADAYFDELVMKLAARMAELTPNIDRLTQNQKDALFSYFYNIGEGNYTKGSPKMQQALRDMDLDTVALNIDAGYNDKKNPGLRKRRDYERALFQSDIQRPVQPMLPVMNNTNQGYIYNPPVEKQRPLAIIPYKTGAWSVANPFMYAPEHEYFLDNGFFGDYRNGGNLFEDGGPEESGAWVGDLERPLHLSVNSPINKAFSPLNAARQPINNEEPVYTLGNWLNNRRDILLKNIQDTGMEEKYNKYFTAMPLFQLQMFPSEDQRIVNNAIESQLHNVESAGYKEDLLPLFTHGRYNTKENAVELSTVLGESGINKDVVKLHEFTHALGHDSPQEAVIRKHFEGRGGKDKYYDNPSELYARLMTFRILHNIDPNKTYTAEDIKNIRQEAAQDFEDIITKPWNEHDKLQNEYAKKLADYLYPKLWPQLKDAWWWNRNGGESGFYNNLRNDFNYARSLANDYNIEIPEDILDIFNRSIKVIDNDNSLQGVRYNEDDDFLRRLSDEDLLFLINEVASAPSKPMDMSNIVARGGKIHIKPENRGKFTALKKRTGHSASWFKVHGTPAQKKMATFALNARKWKHGDGGVIERYGADRVLAAIQKLRG